MRINTTVRRTNKKIRNSRTDRSFLGAKNRNAFNKNRRGKVYIKRKKQ